MQQDGFGNYCLQYVLELGQVQTNAAIMEKLCGHFADLSQQKFSSNVVEKCLKLSASELGEVQEQIVRELIDSPMLPRLLQVQLRFSCANDGVSVQLRSQASSLLSIMQDPYANFVIQTALTVTNGNLHTELVEAIRPFLPSLRGTPFGKVR